MMGMLGALTKPSKRSQGEGLNVLSKHVQGTYFLTKVAN